MGTNSMHVAKTGLNAQQRRMQVIANNLANVNTTGFKRERVNFCLSKVNLEKTNDLFPSELSGGMTKRVAIARAIALNPKYLFCDEPNSGLDPKTAILIDNLILEITEEFNITTIVNTHDMNSVIQIGSNILFIHKGKILWKGNKNDLTKSKNNELNNFVFASKLFKTLRNENFT